MAGLLFGVFVCCFLVQAGYALFFFVSRPDHQLSANTANPLALRVSVIVCARNECANLWKNLPIVLAQKYAADFEVIVVNDGSTDGTEAMLTTMQESQPRLHVVTIDAQAARSLPGKKWAMHQGIAAARYDHILTTDADCRPASVYWLQKMVQPLAACDAVTGYGALERQKSGINGFARAETMHAFMQSASYAHAKLPASAVGRNMAFRKSLYRQGFSGAYARIPSGDDDLLLQQANKPEVVVIADPLAHTSSGAAPSLSAYVRQKQRHLSTGKYYRLPVKLLLGAYALSHALFWLCALLLVFLAPGLLIWRVAELILIRWLIFSFTWQHYCRLLQERQIFFPFFDLGWLAYNAFFAPYILWKNKQEWR